MYTYSLRDYLDKSLSKLGKKNVVMHEQVVRKMEEIVKEPHHYKNLKKPLQHLKRVHVGKSFVLLFSVDEAKKLVIFEEFEHHDRVYQ